MKTEMQDVLFELDRQRKQWGGTVREWAIILADEFNVKASSILKAYRRRKEISEKKLQDDLTR